MTHAKSPREQAVAALEAALETFNPLATAEFNESVPPLIEQAIAALRASTSHAKEIPLKAVDLVDAIRKAETIEAAGVLMADYLLAAAQPEPRPLRELIAEGHKFVWVWTGGQRPRWEFGDLDGNPAVMTIRGLHRNVERYIDCPAIPIPKPTVTPK